MEPNVGKHKPVGGIAAVRLYAPGDIRGASFGSDGCYVTLAGTADEESLFDDRSVFEEMCDGSRGPVSVRHTLTLVSDRNLSGKWLSEEFLRSALVEGFVAYIRLNDGRTLLGGYSERLGGEQPLRLVSLHSQSGAGLSDTPTLTLVLASEDTSPASLITNP